MGGQTALNLAIKAEKIGLLKKYNIELNVTILGRKKCLNGFPFSRYSEDSAKEV